MIESVYSFTADNCVGFCELVILCSQRWGGNIRKLTVYYYYLIYGWWKQETANIESWLCLPVMTDGCVHLLNN